jgi:hypothetical protein
MSRKSVKQQVDGLVYRLSELTVKFIPRKPWKFVSKGIHYLSEFVSRARRWLRPVEGIPRPSESGGFNCLPIDANLKGKLHIKRIIKKRRG